MKKFILIFFALTITASAQIDKSIGKDLGWSWWNSGSTETFAILKDWTVPTKWKSNDTTEWYILSDMINTKDTVVIPFVSIPATVTSGYNMAVKVQFASGPTAYKDAVTLDTLVRCGTGRIDKAAGETTKDSVYYGRSIWFDLTHKYAGADRFRIILAKDTTSASDTDLGTDASTTAKARAGVIRRKN